MPAIIEKSRMGIRATKLMSNVGMVVIFSCYAWASQALAEVPTQEVSNKIATDASFGNHARKIMRLSDGRIFGSFGVDDGNGAGPRN